MNQYYADPSKVEGDIEAQIRQSIAILERLGDDAGLARAWLSMSGVRIVGTRWGEAAEAVERVIGHAQKAGDRVLLIRAGPNLAMCAQFGPTPVPEAIRLREGDHRSLDRRPEGRGGDAAQPRPPPRQARRVRHCPRRISAGASNARGARLEVPGGPHLDRLRPHRDAGRRSGCGRGGVATRLRGADRLGDRNYISTVAAYLAEALCQQGRFDDASTMASFSADVAAPDDVYTQVALRRVRGKAHSWLRRHDAAEAACREAVDLSRTEDDPTDQANALLGPRARPARRRPGCRGDCSRDRGTGAV